MRVLDLLAEFSYYKNNVSQGHRSCAIMSGVLSLLSLVGDACRELLYPMNHAYPFPPQSIEDENLIFCYSFSKLFVLGHTLFCARGDPECGIL